MKIVRVLLSPFSFLYGSIVGVRNLFFDLGWLKSKSYDIPVICVGNISVGGTGKTPHTELIINELREKYRVAMLSRGYRRHSRGFVRADAQSTAFELGDEPMQMHRKFPDITVACDADRVHGIDTLLGMEPVPQVVVLDDAFQHRSVRAGLNIVLIDYNHPVYADCMMPGGRLREPWRRALRRADYVVVTKCPETMDVAECGRMAGRLHIADSSRLAFTRIAYGMLTSLDGHRAEMLPNAMLCLTGIAKPAPFQSYLRTLCPRVDVIEYADHHDFTDKEMAFIQAAFEALSVSRKMIVTTEKDAMRLLDGRLPEALRPYVYYIPIVPVFVNGNNQLIKYIQDYVAANQR